MQGWRGLVRGSAWLTAFAAIAVAATWVYFDFSWPSEPIVVFPGPYSYASVAPLAGSRVRAGRAHCWAVVGSLASQAPRSVGVG
jgi:hypothetical protein